MILFIDTSGGRNRLALYSKVGEFKAEESLPERGTSEVVLSTLERLLQQAKLKKEDLTGIAVVVGPGSFTGLRVGVSFANALGLGLGLPLLGIPAGEDPDSSIKEGRLKRRWLRPNYGAEPKVTIRREISELQQPSSLHTAVGAAFVRDGQVFLGLRMYETEPLWTVPGGRGRKGETLGETLRREVEEEVGITDLQIKRLLGTVPGAHSGDTFYFFECETDQEPKLSEPENFKEWRWVSLNDPPKEFINQRAWDLLVREFVQKHD